MLRYCTLKLAIYTVLIIKKIMKLGNAVVDIAFSSKTQRVLYLAEKSEHTVTYLYFELIFQLDKIIK